MGDQLRLIRDAIVGAWHSAVGATPSVPDLGGLKGPFWSTLIGALVGALAAGTVT